MDWLDGVPGGSDGVESAETSMVRSRYRLSNPSTKISTTLTGSSKRTLTRPLVSFTNGYCGKGKLAPCPSDSWATCTASSNLIAPGIRRGIQDHCERKASRNGS